MQGKLILSVAEAQKNPQAWHDLRALGIGGSEAPTVAGFNPWESAYELWQLKTGKIPQKDLSDNEAVYFGTELEPICAKRFSEITGKKVRKCGTLQDEETPYFFANVDRLIIGENAGLECKTTSAYNAKEWEGDNIPNNYYLQIQWYMGVLGPKCTHYYIACIIGGNKFVWKRVERNDDDIKALRALCSEFWTKYVLTNTPPPVDGSQACTEALKAKYKGVPGLAVNLPAEADDLIAGYKQTKEIIKSYEKTLQTYENKLMDMMGDAEKGETFNGGRISWKLSKPSISFDKDRFKAEHPQMYAEYNTKVGKQSRPFKIL